MSVDLGARATLLGELEAAVARGTTDLADQVVALRAEVSYLRAEVAELRADGPGPPPSPAPDGDSDRSERLERRIDGRKFARYLDENYSKEELGAAFKEEKIARSTPHRWRHGGKVKVGTADGLLSALGESAPDAEGLSEVES